MSGWPRLIVVLTLTALLASCRTAPVHNVEQATFNTTKQLSLAQVTTAIQNAGTTLGWQMRVERPGLIIGTLNLRAHQAVVEIPYDTKTYSILYQSSSNLKYNGKTIHRNYNSWVMNLSREIQVQISSA